MHPLQTISILAGIAVVGCTIAPALTRANPTLANPSQSTQPQSIGEIQQQLIGTWYLVKPAPQTGQRLKFFTGKHWNITQADPQSKQVIFHHGGTYTFNPKGEMVSTVDYANTSTAFRVGTISHFKITVDGDTYTQTGLDNPYSEVWQRVK